MCVCVCVCVRVCVLGRVGAGGNRLGAQRWWLWVRGHSPLVVAGFVLCRTIATQSESEALAFVRKMENQYMSRNNLRTLMRGMRGEEEKALWQKYCKGSIGRGGGWEQLPGTTCPPDMMVLLVLPRKQAVSVMLLAEEAHLVIILLVRDTGSNVLFTCFSPPCAEGQKHGAGEPRQFFNMGRHALDVKSMQWSVAESLLHEGKGFTDETPPFPQYSAGDFDRNELCVDDLLWQDSRVIPLVAISLTALAMDCTFGVTKQQQEGDAAGGTGAYCDGLTTDGNNNSLMWYVGRAGAP